MGDRTDACARMLVRHQWVREQGTPRVTTLAGRREVAKTAWLEWLELTGRSRDRRRFFEQPATADGRWLDRTAAKAAELATNDARAPIAMIVESTVLTRWLAARDDRLAAFIAEGIVHLHTGRPRTRAASGTRDDRARSLAELTLFEALEATDATAGRFELNAAVSFQFGSRAAEIDLLSREDALAVEVDGYHHFGDADHYRRDRRKDLLLQANGYAVLRFLADDVLADPRDAVRTIIELLGRRLGRERLRRTP